MHRKDKVEHNLELIAMLDSYKILGFSFTYCTGEQINTGTMLPPMTSLSGSRCWSTEGRWHFFCSFVSSAKPVKNGFIFLVNCTKIQGCFPLIMKGVRVHKMHVPKISEQKYNIFTISYYKLFSGNFSQYTYFHFVKNYFFFA